MGIRGTLNHARVYPIASAPWPPYQRRSTVQSPSLPSWSRCSCPRRRPPPTRPPILRNRALRAVVRSISARR